MPTHRDRLACRYGLIMSPAPDQIERWERRVRTLVARGVIPDTACDIAAQMVFAGYGLSPLDESVSLEIMLPSDRASASAPAP